MADNITLNQNSTTGAVLKTDENASSEHYQVVKLADGTADSDTVIASGNGTATNSMRVTLASDSTGQVTLTGSPEVSIGAATTALGDLAKAEDQAHATGAVGVMALGVRQSTPANLSGTNGDYEPFQVNAGRLWTDTWAEGDTAHDAADAGNPVKVGGKAYNQDGTAPGTAVAEADRVNAAFDRFGRQYVETSHPWHWRATTNVASAQTDTALKSAPGAGFALAVTDVVFSAAAAQTIKLVENTAGSSDVLEVVYLPANGTVSLHFKTPLVLTTNVDLGYTSTAAVAHSVTVHGYTIPV